jgi:hypothetical protein
MQKLGRAARPRGTDARGWLPAGSLLELASGSSDDDRMAWLAPWGAVQLPEMLLRLHTVAGSARAGGCLAHHTGVRVGGASRLPCASLSDVRSKMFLFCVSVCACAHKLSPPPGHDRLYSRLGAECRRLTD